MHYHTWKIAKYQLKQTVTLNYSTNVLPNVLLCLTSLWCDTLLRKRHNGPALHDNNTIMRHYWPWSLLNKSCLCKQLYPPWELPCLHHILVSKSSSRRWCTPGSAYFSTPTPPCHHGQGYSLSCNYLKLTHTTREMPSSKHSPDSGPAHFKAGACW